MIAKETRRYQAQELRIERREGKPVMLRGMAAVFNSLSEDLGGFREQIAPGAFKGSLDRDIRSFVNHDSTLVLGRTKAGTLRLKETEEGLAFENDLPDTTYARDLIESISVGNLSGVSFGFRTKDDHWDVKTNGDVIRTLLEVELFEISPTPIPAYPDTDVSVAKRSLETFQAQQGPPYDEKAARARKWAWAAVGV